MGNRQAAGVQGDPRGKGPPAAVLPVAQERMAVMGHLHADLMFPSGLGRHLDQPDTARAIKGDSPRELPIVEAGLLGPRLPRNGDPHAAVPLVVDQPIGIRAAGGKNRGFDQRPIELLDRVAWNWAVIRAAAFEVRAKSTTPVTRASRRLITPR